MSSNHNKKKSIVCLMGIYICVRNFKSTIEASYQYRTLQKMAMANQTKGISYFINHHGKIKGRGPTENKHFNLALYPWVYCVQHNVISKGGLFPRSEYKLNKVSFHYHRLQPHSLQSHRYARFP